LVWKKRYNENKNGKTGIIKHENGIAGTIFE